MKEKPSIFAGQEICMSELSAEQRQLSFWSLRGPSLPERFPGIMPGVVGFGSLFDSFLKESVDTYEDEPGRILVVLAQTVPTRTTADGSLVPFSDRELYDELKRSSLLFQKDFQLGDILALFKYWKEGGNTVLSRDRVNVFFVRRKKSEEVGIVSAHYISDEGFHLDMPEFGKEPGWLPGSRVISMYSFLGGDPEDRYRHW